jgi:hypothetical protein
MSRKALRIRTRRIHRLKTGVVAMIVAAFAVAGIVAPATAATTATTVFGSIKPTVAADSDRSAVELGMLFYPQKTGSVTALQYYQGRGAKGVTTATLWKSSGAVLARAKFTSTSTEGWRTIKLSKPVQLTAGKPYVVSYHAPNGGYPVTPRAFTAKQSLNGFTIPANAGRYHYGSTSGYPTKTYNASSYLVDVIYRPGLLTAQPAPTPTPPPTTTPPPSSSGGFVVLGRSFPSSATTGVPAGTTLTKYTGPCTIQTAGYVIDKKQVDCDLRILAKNVVIKNSKINGSVYADYTENKGSFSITDSEVDAGDGPWTGIGDAWFTATRVEVTGGTRSINCYANCTVRDSYVHGQLHDRTGVHHESGIRINTNSTLVHNTIACDAPDFPPDAGCSAAISGYPDFDPVQNNLVDNNLIIAGSGGYCSYGGSTAGKPYSGQTKNIRFTNNVYQKGTSGQCGFWGAITSFDIRATGNVWSNNLFDDGTVVKPAN